MYRVNSSFSGIIFCVIEIVMLFIANIQVKLQEFNFIVCTYITIIMHIEICDYATMYLKISGPLLEYNISV